MTKKNAVSKNSINLLDEVLAVGELEPVEVALPDASMMVRRSWTGDQILTYLRALNASTTDLQKLTEEQQRDRNVDVYMTMSTSPRKDVEKFVDAMAELPAIAFGMVDRRIGQVAGLIGEDGNFTFTSPRGKTPTSSDE